MEKPKVIVEKGVLYLTHKGDIIPAQVSLRLEDDCDDTLPVATVSFIVDIEDSVSSEYRKNTLTPQDYEKKIEYLTRVNESQKETIKKATLESIRPVFPNRELDEEECSVVKKMLNYMFK